MDTRLEDVVYRSVALCPQVGTEVRRIVRAVTYNWFCWFVMDKMDTEDTNGSDLSQKCRFVIQKPLDRN